MPKGKKKAKKKTAKKRQRRPRDPGRIVKKRKQQGPVGDLKSCKVVADTLEVKTVIPGRKGKRRPSSRSYELQAKSGMTLRRIRKSTKKPKS